MSLRDGLKTIDSISGKLINDKKFLYYRKTIKKKNIAEYEQKGWQVVPSKLKKSVRMVLLKPHNIAFEDRVWALLAKMGFTYLNGDANYKIDYQNGLTKQIDVFAVDDEAAIVIECKSAQGRRKVSYQKEINEIIGLKEKIRNSIRNEFGRNIKVAFLFATNNAIISDNDSKRLKEGMIDHINQDDIDYFELLTDHLGVAAKYQLFGKLFSGQKIPNIQNRIPAIKGKVSKGHTFYSFSIDPMYLLKIGYILHRTQTDPEAASAYQRIVKKGRLKNIGEFIDTGGYFANSVIINIQTKGRKKLKYEMSENIEHDSATSMGILHLPKQYRSAFIIDGQHRLLGYSIAKSNSNHTIPVVAFHNLPIDEQAKLFVKINHTQKSVPANLLQSIIADFDWKSDNDRLAINALKTRLFVDMNADERSPLYKRIILSEEKKNETRCLTLQTLRSWGFGKTNYFGILKGDKLLQTGHLHDVDYDKTLKKSHEFFTICFSAWEDELPAQWSIGSGEGGFISMNLGIAAILRVINDIIEFLVLTRGFKPQLQSGEELAFEVVPFLMPAIEYVKNLDQNGLNKLRKLFGSGAPEKVQREFQYAIHKKYSEFNPQGLQQWIKESSGEFTKKSYALGHYKIEPLIDGFIKQKLKEEYGEKNWWTEGVPTDIQLSCSREKILKRSQEPESHFLNTIYYEKIIDNNWGLLQNYFTPPGLEQAGKAKRVAWLGYFNSIRQKYSHPQREDVTEKEYLFIEDLYEWLQKKLV
ncbi:MAG: DGQHR domain-containing protein [Candidatus Glassbacteria bacterium]|nr:DGQHR domain-containing protein [Candidatus Glassbacteria bacterium]